MLWVMMEHFTLKTLNTLETRWKFPCDMSSPRGALDKGYRTKPLSTRHVQQQIRRQHAVAVEETLKQHPLILHPHVEQGMPPELFDQLISILDPDTSVNQASSAVAECGEEKNVVNCKVPEKEEAVEVEDRLEEGASVINERNADIQRSPKNAYVRLQLHENASQEDQGVGNNTGLRSPSQDEDVTKVTKLLCDWAHSLGGETNITESALLDLFARGFEKKPSPSFPVQAINSDNLPDDPLCHALHRKDTNGLLEDSAAYKKKLGTKKPIYGAWYLDPKTWKKRNAGEPLQDPDVIPEVFEFQTSEKDEELKELHGTHAFRRFIISKGLKAPKFLSDLYPEEEQDP